MKNKISSALFPAFKSSLPVFAGYLVMGFAFGVLLAGKGFGVEWAFGMSLFMYTGSLQFLAVDMLAEGASLLSAAILTVLVNGRYLFYSVSMLSRYQNIGRGKSYLIFSLTDETYTIVSADPPDGVDRKTYDVLLSVFDHIYWVFGCTLGGFIGTILPFNTDGIDFSMTALFIVFFMDKLRTDSDRVPAAVSLICGVACLVFFGAANFLIPALTSTTAALLILKAVRERRSAK